MSNLALVSTSELTISQRVQRLQAEAKSLAAEHVVTLLMNMNQVQHLAYDIANGGDAYPAGIRDIARRLVEDMDQKAMTVQAIAGR